jgi:hypothetical protein
MNWLRYKTNKVNTEREREREREKDKIAANAKILKLHFTTWIPTQQSRPPRSIMYLHDLPAKKNCFSLVLSISSGDEFFAKWFRIFGNHWNTKNWDKPNLNAWSTFVLQKTKNDLCYDSGKNCKFKEDIIFS